MAYHHEDLRRALLDAAIVHLRSGDITALTIQLLARAVGVSPAAPYHHFSDKIAVLAALAEEGFALWLARATKAVEEAADGEALGALARSWLDFGTSHPSHYRVMFLREIEDRERFSSLHEVSGRGLALLVRVLSDRAPGLSQAELLGCAVTVWSTMHGFSALRDAGVLANIPGLPPLSALEAETIASVEGVVGAASQVSRRKM